MSRHEHGPPPSRRDTFLAFAPYLIIILVLGITSISGITKELGPLTSKYSWPGLHVRNSKGKAPSSEVFKLNYLTAAGTWLFVSGVLTALVLRVRPGVALRTYWSTPVQLQWAIVTVMAVLAPASKRSPARLTRHSPVSAARVLRSSRYSRVNLHSPPARGRVLSYSLPENGASWVQRCIAGSTVHRALYGASRLLIGLAALGVRGAGCPVLTLDDDLRPRRAGEMPAAVLVSMDA